MTAKGVFLFLFILLFSGTSFSFPTETLHFEEQEFSETDFEFEAETTDLSDGTVPFFKAKVFKVHSLAGSKSFLLKSSFETRSHGDYIKRSKEINPGLDIPDIIFPFHVFL